MKKTLFCFKSIHFLPENWYNPSDMFNPHEYKTKIVELQKNKDYPQAYEVLKAARQFYPTDLFFLTSEVYLLLRLNKTKEAREKAEERMERLKNDPFFLKTYLNILARLGAKDDIEEVLEKTIFAQKTGSEDFYLYLSQLLRRVFDKEKALGVLRRALTIFPESSGIKEQLEKLEKDECAQNKYHYYKEKFKGKKIEDAIEEIENIKILPSYALDWELLLFLAELYKKNSNYPKAIDAYQQSLSIKDNEFTRKMLGYTYYKTGNFKNALLYLQDIFLKLPGDYFLYSTIFNIFKEKNDFEGYSKLLNQVLSANPQAKHLYGLLSRAKRWIKP
ncbi:MAG: tetratricopeptide repeat protein [Elusimicrobiota bacterium]